MYKLYRIDSLGDCYLIGEEDTLEKANIAFEEASRYGFSGQKVFLEEWVIKKRILSAHLF